jgi:hypothetical protein
MVGLPMKCHTISHIRVDLLNIEYNDLDSPECLNLFNASSTIPECLAIKVKGLVLVLSS